MSNTAKLEARIAVLEAKDVEREKDLVQVYKDIKEHMDDEEKDREILLSKISDIQKEITHYKGVIGGIILTVSAVFTAIGVGLKYLG